MQVAREEILGLVSTRVTKEQRVQIEAEPMGEEVRKTFKKLPKSKALGIDGMIVKVFLTC